MEPEELVFNFDSTAKMDASDEEIVKVALKQVERTMKDLSERSSQGYAIGYELGYIPLEHPWNNPLEWRRIQKQEK